MYQNSVNNVISSRAKLLQGLSKECFKMDYAATLASIPATSCSGERSFSGLRGIKSYPRSTMGHKGLNSVALINIQRAKRVRLCGTIAAKYSEINCKNFKIVQLGFSLEPDTMLDLLMCSTPSGGRHSMQDDCEISRYQCTKYSMTTLPQI